MVSVVNLKMQAAVLRPVQSYMYLRITLKLYNLPLSTNP